MKQQRNQRLSSIRWFHISVGERNDANLMWITSARITLMNFHILFSIVKIYDMRYSEIWSHRVSYSSERRKKKHEKTMKNRTLIEIQRFLSIFSLFFNIDFMTSSQLLSSSSAVKLNTKLYWRIRLLFVCHRKTFFFFLFLRSSKKKVVKKNEKK